MALPTIDHGRGPDVEARAVAHRLARCRAGSRSGRRAASSTGRARSTPASSRCTRSTTERSRKKLLPKSKRRKFPIISRKRSCAGLSKPNWRSSSRDELRDRARARRGTCSSPRRRCAAARALPPATSPLAAAEARRRPTRRALQLRDHLLDRPARRRLDDDEVEHHDPEQRRDHEQQAAEDVGEHRGTISDAEAGAVRAGDPRRSACRQSQISPLISPCALPAPPPWPGRSTRYRAAHPAAASTAGRPNLSQ